MESSGTDAEGHTFSSPTELWQKIKAEGGEQQWYSKAVDYWDNQDASYNGVLGGYGHLTDPDIRESRILLKKAFREKLQEAADGSVQLTAVDCGAGVGRVTEQLLLHHFHTVDMVEPSKKLLDVAKQKLSNPAALGMPPGHRLGQLICCGVQDFKPEANRYDCIWVQWVLLYLTDVDLLAFLERCRVNLKEGGIILVKENICKEGFVVDDEDSSLTRSSSYFMELFDKANMQVLYNVKQRDFPKGLYDVRMYVLKPRGLGSPPA